MTTTNECIIDAIKKYNNNTELLQYLQTIQNEQKHKCVMQTSFRCVTTLMLAIKRPKSKKVVFKLIEIGGRELVMMKENFGTTALHCACTHKHTSLEIISKLIELGGKELVMERDTIGQTALHYLCMNKIVSMDESKNKNISMDVLSKLLEVGGRELVMAQSTYNHTALHYACKDQNISPHVVSMLLKVGGKELVMVNNYYGTALHYAFDYITVNPDIVSKLIEVGGKDLVMVNSSMCGTVLHKACIRANNLLIHHISKLIDVGGGDLLMVKDGKGRTALQSGYFHGRKYPKPEYNKIFEFLVKKYILEGIGGEFEIGGLFSFEKKIRKGICKNWGKCVPALKSVLNSLQGEQRQQQQQQPPLLHAAIVTKVPLNVIQSIIKEFEYSALKRDSLNRIPLEVALEEGLRWTELQEVIQATVAKQQHGSIIYTAAQYGLKWEYDAEKHGMKELTCKTPRNVDEVMDSYDSLTGLRLFMVAAMGDCHDLSSIYGIMKMSPQIVNIL